MALQASGPISFAEIAAEFGDTPPHSLSEFYRDGGKVPSNNSNVPTSGAIGFGHFFNAVNEIVVTATAAASLNLSTAFGSNWAVNVPKRLIVPSGVILGPVTIPSGMAGSLILQNDGEIQGIGGAPNGTDGGHAITSSQTFTLINTGAVRGGGGGGGRGGAGGHGRVTVYGGCGPLCGGCNSCPSGSTQTVSVNWCARDTYSKSCSAIYNYYSGGTGGAGGRGRGYNQTPVGGSAGTAGGTNAGTGGTGATGGEWGVSGGTGFSGANGNYTNGASGNPGGNAGRAVHMVAGNTGVINGVY